MADITVQNLTKYYGDRLILDGISFDIQPGEKVALLGGNGAGKTTLFNILSGRIPYDSGVVAVGDGRTVGIIDQIPVVRGGASVDSVLRLAFQEADTLRRRQSMLADKMAAGDQSAATLAAYGAVSDRLEWMGGYNYDYEIDKVCAGLAIPKSQRAQEFALLSGGEKTRVNLARIILEHTDILLLDEPTNHLDMDSVRWLGDYLDAYRGTVLT
ncbi:MAG: ATP-binding cassette domain-containing protein, partial [Eubacteriales bacterium]|nr:ATP-binding cassette domain-containing protein [Eubacteriales bacterium]